MKSAIFLTWFFTIVFFSHGVNTPGATASCVVPAAIKQAAVAKPAEAINALKPVELPAEEPAQAEMVAASYTPAEVEPASGEAPRFNPLARSAERYGDNAESYYQGKQDQLMQALMR